MPLHTDYRPTTFKKFVGSETTVKSIQDKLKKEDHPHVYLITGPSGCGKTTLSRIIARQIGALLKDEDPTKSMNYREYDSADFRGIDTIRDIRKNIKLSPIGGASARLWLLDECFAKGSLVNTPHGLFPIEKIQPFDQVYSLAGLDTVEKVFQNKVDVSRVMRLKFNNGVATYCSDSHEFFTDRGWVFAKDLTPEDFIFSFSSDILSKEKSDINLLGMNDENEKTLQILREADQLLSQSPKEISESILQQKLLGETQTHSNRVPKKTIWGSGKEKTINVQNTDKPNGTWESPITEKFQKDEKIQSDEQSPEHNKNEEYQKDKWDSKYMERGEGRKRETHRTSDVISNGSGLGCGSVGEFGEEEVRVSNQLQNRHSQQGSFDWGGGGRTQSQYEKEYKDRFKKDPNAEFLRLENSEIYQPGNNDESFFGVIGDTEKNQGYVIFYDLQIKKHPSYFVNGVSVHNCHQLTKDAQEALLKALEEAKGHVYFVLATTNPEKLKDTLKRRCAEYKVQPVGESDMIDFLYGIAAEEDKDLPEAVAEKIETLAMGSIGKALSMLDRVIDLKEKDAMNQLEADPEDKQIIDLCQNLIKKAKWTVIAKIIDSLTKTQEPESIRRAVLGYCSAILMKGENSRAYLIMDAFRNPFYDTPKPQLILAAYESLYAE